MYKGHIPSWAPSTNGRPASAYEFGIPTGCPLKIMHIECCKDHSHQFAIIPAKVGLHPRFEYRRQLTESRRRATEEKSYAEAVVALRCAVISYLQRCFFKVRSSPRLKLVLLILSRKMVKSVSTDRRDMDHNSKQMAL